MLKNVRRLNYALIPVVTCICYKLDWTTVKRYKTFSRTLWRQIGIDRIPSNYHAQAIFMNHFIWWQAHPGPSHPKSSRIIAIVSEWNHWALNKTYNFDETRNAFHLESIRLRILPSGNKHPVYFAKSSPLRNVMISGKEV